MTRGRQLLLAGVAVAGSVLLAASLQRWLAAQALTFTLAGVQLQLLEPQRLALVAFLPLLVYVASAGIPGLSVGQRRLSLALRLLLTCALIAALARPTRTLSSSRLCTVLAVDVSDSISDLDLQLARAWVREALRSAGDNQVRLLTFAGDARARELRADSSLETLVHRHTEHGEAHDATDAQAALQLAYGLLPSGVAKRVVLISDGNETRGSLGAEAARARRAGVQVDTKALVSPRPAEVTLRGIELPAHIDVGKRFTVRVKLFSTSAARARLTLYQDQVINGQDGVRELSLPAGNSEQAFSSIAYVPGHLEYRAQLQPHGADHFAENNLASAAGFAIGNARVLLVDRDPTQLTAASRALEQSGFSVELRSPEGLPRSSAELARYDFVVLSDVPARAVSPESLDAIERYVRDAGGGFMLAGGEQSFGPGGYQGTRMEQLLPVRMASERRRESHSLALALVIDCSGSMAGRKLELAKEAARATAAVLGDDDSIEVIGFAAEPERRVRLQSASNRLGIAQNIARLAASGGTQIFAALDAAYRDLGAARARLKHVILLTDGQSQETGIPELAQAMHADSITLSTVGLGDDVNRNLMQTVAALGGGRAYFTSDPSNIPRIFVDETTGIERQPAVDELVRISVHQPADFLKGVALAGAPFLRGYLSTQPKPAPAQVILESELGEPILARWHVGLGYALAWTTDLNGHWSADLLRWPGFARLFGQLVREHARTLDLHELPMQVRVEDGRAHVAVDALGEDDRFLDGLQSELTLQPSAAQATGRATPHVVLAQTAPGRYEGALELPGYGAFMLEAVHRRAGSIFARSHAQAQNPYPAEYAALGANTGLLRQLAAQTGGRFDPAPGEIWRAPGRPVRAQEDLWPGLIAAALGLFLLDVWVRRVRLFDKTYD